VDRAAREELSRFRRLSDSAVAGDAMECWRAHRALFPAQRAQNRRQEHVCFRVFWDEQIICKPPWGSVRAAFFQKGSQNHLFAGIDASPLERDTA